VNRRIQFLDVLRGIAVLAAIASHYPIVLHFNSVLLSAGNCGVDLFFVISGFLISGLLFSEYSATRKIDPIRFWIRRGFKIYPPFYTFFAATIVMFAVVTRAIPRELIYESVFLQNYFPHVWPHTWSLAVEEHFYLILPLLLLALIWSTRNAENPFRLIPLISITISILCLFFRIVAMRHGTDWEHVGFPTHMRMDALFAGVALGYYAHFEPDSFREARRPLVLIVGVVFSLTLIVLPDALRITFAYVTFCCLVAWAANHSGEKIKLLRPIAWIGYYSYSIYLWQVFIMMALPTFPATWYRFPLYLASAVALGVSAAKVVELPMLRMRETFFPSKLSRYTPQPTLGGTPAVTESQP
jgi:peptidoglycan/LPS O-acetylase OafA/YrhL